MSPNPNVDNHMHLKMYPDYRWTFITGSGYTPDPRVWRGPERPHPLMTRERAVEWKWMVVNASTLRFGQ